MLFQASDTKKISEMSSSCARQGVPVKDDRTVFYRFYVVENSKCSKFYVATINLANILRKLALRVILLDY